MKNKGFTLIELLIALTIFAVIALGIYSTFSTGLNVWRRDKDANRLQQEARWALDKISKELRNAVIYNYGPDYPEASAFLGEGDKISFLSSVYNFSTRQSQIKRITYSLELPQYGEIHKTQIGTRGKTPGQIVSYYEESQTPLNSLERREETLIQHLQIQESVPVQSEPLTKLVKADGLLFSYAFEQETEAGNTIIWQDTWTDTAKLPKGIRITLILQNPDRISEEAIFTKTVFLAQGETGQE